MKFKELALLIAEREGKKRSLSIAQINEVLRILRDLYCERPLEMLDFFWQNARYSALRGFQSKRDAKRAPAKRGKR